MVFTTMAYNRAVLLSFHFYSRYLSATLLRMEIICKYLLPSYYLESPQNTLNLLIYLFSECFTTWHRHSTISPFTKRYFSCYHHCISWNEHSLNILSYQRPYVLRHIFVDKSVHWTACQTWVLLFLQGDVQRKKFISFSLPLGYSGSYLSSNTARFYKLYYGNHFLRLHPGNRKISK